MQTEQGVLRVSISVTFLLAAAGIVFGLLAGSFAIVFDGVYALIDATMTIVALLVSNLIAASTAAGVPTNRLVKHFTMGFWHLEPMVLGLNGILLTGAAIYALINAIGSILAGGRLLAFDYAILYAALTMLIAFGMAAYGKRANRDLDSAFVALDAKAWLMAGGLSAALFVAFAFGYAIQGTTLAWLLPYVDPVALAVSYVARVGRGKQIELNFIVPKGGPAKRLEEWDRIRDEIGAAIGDDTPDRWLTIAFTTDSEWAD